VDIVSVNAKQPIARNLASQNPTIDFFELNDALSNENFDRQTLIHAMYMALCRGYSFSEGARAYAFSRIGGFVACPLQRITRGPDDNVAFLSIEHWLNQLDALRPLTVNPGSVVPIVEQAVVGSANPNLVAQFLKSRISRLTNRYPQLHAVLDRLELITTQPHASSAAITLGLLQHSFYPLAFQFSWIQGDRQIVDLIALFNELLADKSLSHADVDRFIAFCKHKNDPPVEFAVDLESLLTTLRRLPESYVETHQVPYNDPRQRLLSWLRHTKTNFNNHRHPALPVGPLVIPTGEPTEASAATFSVLGRDPFLVDRYLRLVANGTRDSFEVYAYAPEPISSLNDPLGDYALMQWFLYQRSGIYYYMTEARTSYTEWNGTLSPPSITRILHHRDAARYALGDFAQLPDDAEELRLNPVERPLSCPPLAIDASINPIRFDPFVAMLSQILLEESVGGITPSIGTVHEWSTHFVSNYRHAFPWNAHRFPKLLAALNVGETARYLPTGQELALTRFIVDSPRRSVTFDILFRESYRLSQGNVYLTLLTMENVLNKHWREFDTRDARRVTSRLAPITNIDPEHDDLFGSWYHLAGQMLWGYSHGKLWGFAAGLSQSTLSHVFNILVNRSFRVEQQEIYLDYYGWQLGARLRQLIEKKQYLVQTPNPANRSPHHYLNLDSQLLPSDRK